jgi:hypothetical protein
MPEKIILPAFTMRFSPVEKADEIHVSYHVNSERDELGVGGAKMG